MPPTICDGNAAQGDSCRIRNPLTSLIFMHRTYMNRHVFLCLVLSSAVYSALALEPHAETNDSAGFLHHSISSRYQEGETVIRVLLPDAFDADTRYPVLYVLPVVAGAERRYGDGLLEVKRHDLQNRFGLICVAPEFTNAPWFVNHASDPHRQDESHYIDVVLPFIEKTYPTRQGARGRLLLGFSKSGRGAFSLLLRYPDMFYKAAGWDSAVLLDMDGLTDTERSQRIRTIFGTEEHFETYRLTELIRRQGKNLGNEIRLFYYANSGHRQAAGAKVHRLLNQLEIPHRYQLEPKRRHRWDSGWIPTAVAFLAEPVYSSGQ